MKFWKITVDGQTFITKHEFEKDAYVSVFKNIGADYTEEERYLTVSVRFPHSSKSYTYLTDRKYKPGDYAVVEAFDKVYGVDTLTFKLVQVMSCQSYTKEELEKALPFDRYRKIVGTVDWN